MDRGNAVGCVREEGNVPVQGEGRAPIRDDGEARGEHEGAMGPHGGWSPSDEEREKQVTGDIARVAGYWGARKDGWLDEAGAEFEHLVRPIALYGNLPCPVSRLAGVDATNMCFTEWFLFERPLRGGRTPLQLYVGNAPACEDGVSLSRLRQIEQTQFFSRFAIVDKGSDGFAELRDVRTDRWYRVFDPVLCGRARWRDGTIAERIGCVDGMWCVVGQARLYDRASPDATALDGPGELHSEDLGNQDMLDASYFIRLVRDVMGAEGRYAHTLTLRSADDAS